MNVTEKFQLHIGQLRYSTNRKSEFSSHSYESRTKTAQSKRASTDDSSIPHLPMVMPMEDHLPMVMPMEDHLPMVMPMEDHLPMVMAMEDHLPMVMPMEDLMDDSWLVLEESAEERLGMVIVMKRLWRSKTCCTGST